MPKKQRFKYDVFISYSHQNKKWVQDVLLPRLENAGLRVFIDFRDFEIGAASIKEMERGVIQSKRILVVLTPEYLRSGWTDFEILMAQTLSPANQSRRVIPVLKKVCKLPVSIGFMNYVDLVNPKGKESEWERLIKALGGMGTAQKILVVDDKPDVQKTIVGLLEDATYKVFVAKDENSAYQILKQETVDFAIIDIRLHEDTPDDESGLKLANAIHTLASKIKIVILSGSTLPRHIISAFKDSGVIDYIMKTLGWEERLLRVIKAASTKPKRSK